MFFKLCIPSVQQIDELFLPTWIKFVYFVNKRNLSDILKCEPSRRSFKVDFDGISVWKGFYLLEVRSRGLNMEEVGD